MRKSRAVPGQSLLPRSPARVEVDASHRHHKYFEAKNPRTGVLKTLPVASPKVETDSELPQFARPMAMASVEIEPKRETGLKRSRSPSSMRLISFPKRESEHGIEFQPQPLPLPELPVQKKRRQLDERQRRILAERAQNRPRGSDGRFLPGHAVKDCAICAETKTVAEYPTARISATCAHAPSTCLECIRTSIKADSQARQWDHIACPECGERLDYFSVKKYADEEAFGRQVFSLDS